MFTDFSPLIIGIDYIEFLEFTDDVPILHLSNQRSDSASSPINIQNGLPFGDRVHTIAYVSTHRRAK